MAEIEIGIGQVGTAGLRVRRHRHRAEPAHPGPRGRRHLLGDRRLPLRAAAAWRSAMDGVVSPATAIEIGRLGGVGVLNLEGLWTRYEDPDAAARRDRRPRRPRRPRARMQQIYARADQARADRASASARSRTPASPSCASVTPQRTAAVRPAHPRGRARPPRHPGHGRLGRARVQDRRAAQPQDVRPRARHPRDRRRLRQLPGRPAPHAHRRRRRARRRRPRPRLHHPRRARHRRAPGHRHRRRPGRPHAPPRRDRRLLPRHRRRRHGHRRRHRQGHRLRRRRRDDRLAAGRRPRGARPGLPLGHGHLPPDAAPRRPGQDHRPGARCRRSWSARPTRTTAA